MDLSRAVYWYTEAARAEEHWAEEQLGAGSYEHGIGVTKDRKLAIDWYKKSDQHGGYCWAHLKRLGEPETVKGSRSAPKSSQSPKTSR